MGAKCCSCGKGAVKDDESVITAVDLQEQRRELREMEAEEAARADVVSSEQEHSSPNSRTREVLQNFSAVSVELQEEISSVEESPPINLEEALSSPNILWSTDSFSGLITSGYYSVIPDKRLTHFKNMPTSSELGALGDEGADVIQIDLEGDQKLCRVKELIINDLATDSDLEKSVKRIAGLVEKVLPRETPESPAVTTPSSNSRLLGDIKHGTCRSRAILFKVLADTVGIESKLVVGFPGDLTANVDSHNHISVVVVIDNEVKLVDLVRAPRQLIPMSDEAIYHAHTSTPWNSACHSPLEPTSPNTGSGAGQLDIRRMMRAIARAMRVIKSSKHKGLSNEIEITMGESSQQNINDIWNEMLGSPTFQNKRLLPYEEWNIDISEVKEGTLIGRGCSGEVYRGSWCGTDVAIKVFPEQDLTVENIKDFCNEISILSRLRHPNVILFIGACTKPPLLSLVTELMENKSLYHLLYSPGEKTDLTWKRKLEMLLDICKGLMYIHQMGIVHRDLKSANCLLNDQWKVKICDFGLSRFLKDMTVKDTEAAGTPEWMAPEVIRNEPFSEKCDIYSFGVIMWELSTLSKPWKGVPLDRVVYTVGYEGARLEIPDGPLGKLITDCWSEPEQRPSCEEILTRLASCEYSF